jgi:hypothetical protein
MLLEYLTNGTGHTVTGKSVGCEVETDFVDAVTGEPITPAVSRAILASDMGRPAGCVHKLELGLQKIELAVGPCDGFPQLFERTLEGLDWLYSVAERHGARPLFEPEIEWEGDLLDVSTDPRDQLWIELDGQAALEELCRCSSVQFTVSVSRGEAIPAVNALWESGLHLLDYEPNHLRWLAYIERSKAAYRPDRYGGPAGFDSLAGYAAQLGLHDVVMDETKLIRMHPERLEPRLVDLFLRSVWWHYRLRRYRDTLALEIRAQARRHDAGIIPAGKRVASILGL